MLGCVQIPMHEENQNIKKMRIPLYQTYKQNGIIILPPKMDQHAGGKWWIHGIKHYTDNQLETPDLLCIIS